MMYVCMRLPVLEHFHSHQGEHSNEKVEQHYYMGYLLDGRSNVGPSTLQLESNNQQLPMIAFRNKVVHNCQLKLVQYTFCHEEK